MSDEVDGILRLARSAEHEPVNIGNPTEFTILECAQQVIATTGSASQIKFEALPQDDPKQRRPDISKASGCWGGNRKWSWRAGSSFRWNIFAAPWRRKSSQRSRQIEVTVRPSSKSNRSGSACSAHAL